MAADERDGSDHSDSDEDAELAPARSANVGFAFLADSDSDSEASDDEHDGEQARKEVKDEDDDAGKNAVEVEQERESAPSAPQRDATKKSNAKKKKKKNQKKKKLQGCGDVAADLGDENEEKADAAQDVDEILDEILAAETDTSLRVAGGAAGSTARDQYENSLLSVDLKFINADKEMKRIFGVPSTLLVVVFFSQLTHPGLPLAFCLGQGGGFSRPQACRSQVGITTDLDHSFP